MFDRYIWRQGWWSIIIVFSFVVLSWIIGLMASWDNNNAWMILEKMWMKVSNMFNGP